MTKADQIRAAAADPAARARSAQDAAAAATRTGAKVARKARGIVAEAVDGGDLDEAALDVLAARLAALVSLDSGDNAALLHDLLPPYVEHLRAR